MSSSNSPSYAPKYDVPSLGGRELAMKRKEALNIASHLAKWRLEIKKNVKNLPLKAPDIIRKYIETLAIEVPHASTVSNDAGRVWLNTYYAPGGPAWLDRPVFAYAGEKMNIYEMIEQNKIIIDALDRLFKKEKITFAIEEGTRLDRHVIAIFDKTLYRKHKQKLDKYHATHDRYVFTPPFKDVLSVQTADQTKVKVKPKTRPKDIKKIPSPSSARGFPRALSAKQRIILDHLQFGGKHHY